MSTIVRTPEQLADIEATQRTLASLLTAQGVPDGAAQQLVAAGDYVYVHTRHGAQLCATFPSGRTVLYDVDGITAAAELLASAYGANAQRARHGQLRAQKLTGSL